MIGEAKRFNVAACGRRIGKTTLGEDRLVVPALDGYPVAWFSPFYKMLDPVWREVLDLTEPIQEQVSVQNKMIKLITGGVIDFWSLDDPNAARGRKYARVIVDEAAMVKNLSGAWQEVLRATLADYRGDAWFLSTPKGMNFFKLMFSWGQSKDPKHHEWMSWQMPTSVNPSIHPDEIEAARLSLPERIFGQEYLAEFLDTEGAVFRGVMEASEGWQEQAAPIPGHEYAMGVDWGKLNDYTVITVMDTTSKTVAAMRRFNQINYSIQLERMKELVYRFNPTVIMPERNSIGEPLIERMRDEFDWPVVPFTMTNASKQLVIDRLSMAIETRDIGIPDNDDLLSELLAFEAERLPSGLLRYGAPEGMHDDCVISLALAWQAINSTPAWFSFMNADREAQEKRIEATMRSAPLHAPPEIVDARDFR